MIEIKFDKELFQEFISSIREVVKEEISRNSIAELTEKFLSPEETCKLFQPAITKPTLESYSQQSLLRKYYLGGRTWYKYSEILQALEKIKQLHLKRSTHEHELNIRRRRHKIQSDTLDEVYVKQKLRSSGFRKEEVDSNPEIINLKRTTLQLKRDIKQQNDGKR